MKGFTLLRLGRIRNTWVRAALGEILSTFVLGVFVYGAGAQYLLSHGAASSGPGRALASGCGLMLAVYTGFKASGGCANPCITLMFCLTGKLSWKKWPIYALSQFVGAYLAAGLTYGVYNEMIDMYEGGLRTVAGENNTGSIFMTFPAPGISKASGFFEAMVGCGLLTATVCAVIDPRNANPAPGLIPLIFPFLLYGILSTYGLNAGSPINPALDFSGRLLAYTVGYGEEVFTHADYWFWVPPLACICGTVVSCSVYQLMVGNHLQDEDEWDLPQPDVTVERIGRKAAKFSTESDLSALTNGTSITTISTEKF